MLRTPRLRRFVQVLVTAALVPGLCLAAKRSGRDAWQWPQRVVEDLGLKEGSRVADIGCGRGYFTFRLAKAVGEKGKVFATEISSRSLKSVANRVKKDKLANVETVLAAPVDTKLAVNSLDAAIIVNVYHHAAKGDRPALTKSIAKALRPGGYLYIIDWRFDAKIKYDIGRRVPRKELLQVVKDAGLTLDAEFLYLEHQLFLRCRKPAQDD